MTSLQLTRRFVRFFAWSDQSDPSSTPLSLGELLIAICQPPAVI